MTFVVRYELGLLMACPISMTEAGRGAMALEAKEDGVHEAFDVQRGMRWGTVTGRAQPSPDEERGVCLETLGRDGTARPSHIPARG